MVFNNVLSLFPKSISLIGVSVSTPKSPESFKTANLSGNMQTQDTTFVFSTNLT